jgi:peptidylprolyl isomerase
MAQAKTGDNVTVHYTGKLADGTVFDTSKEREPLNFAIGDGNLIPGFESAVVGMAAGESKTTEIPAEQAYGPHRDDMVLTVDRQQIPDTIPLDLGQQLQIQHPNGQAIPVLVTEISDGKVTLDANHPLAGKDLTFEIELLAIA